MRKWYKSGSPQLTQHFGPCFDSVLEEWYMRELRITCAAFTKHSATICCTRALLASDIPNSADPLFFMFGPSLQDCMPEPVLRPKLLSAQVSCEGFPNFCQLSRPHATLKWLTTRFSGLKKCTGAGNLPSPNNNHQMTTQVYKICLERIRQSCKLART